MRTFGAFWLAGMFSPSSFWQTISKNIEISTWDCQEASEILSRGVLRLIQATTSLLRSAQFRRYASQKFSILFNLNRFLMIFNEFHNLKIEFLNNGLTNSLTTWFVSPHRPRLSTAAILSVHLILSNNTPQKCPIGQFLPKGGRTESLSRRLLGSCCLYITSLSLPRAYVLHTWVTSVRSHPCRPLSSSEEHG